MEAMGYRYRKTDNIFSKTNGEAVDRFSVSFDGRGGLVSVNGGFSVLLPKVETLLAKAFKPRYSWSAGASFLNAGAKPHQYDLFVMEYAELTPKQKAAIDPDLVHPQERIDEARACLLDIHERHARKLFEQVTTARALYDLMLDAMRGDVWAMRMSVQLPVAMRNALVLGAALGLDTNDIYRYAEAYDVRYKTQFATNSVREADAFLSTASPGDLGL